MQVETVRKMTPALVRQRNLLEAIALADSQPAVTRCAECKWYWRGTVGEGKQAFAAHRKVHA